MFFSIHNLDNTSFKSAFNICFKVLQKRQLNEKKYEKIYEKNN